MLHRAFSVRQAPAVILLINSPGGSPVQSHMLHRRIRALAEQKEKPVIAVVEDVAASGGYMIACAGDEIVADPASIVGSIGVVSAGFGFTGLLDRLGVERRVHTAGSRKAMLDPFRPERPEDVAHLEQTQADIHAHFIALVKERRGERLSIACSFVVRSGAPEFPKFSPREIWGRRSGGIAPAQKSVVPLPVVSRTWWKFEGGVISG